MQTTGSQGSPQPSALISALSELSNEITFDFFDLAKTGHVQRLGGLLCRSSLKKEEEETILLLLVTPCVSLSGEDIPLQVDHFLMS